jgi:hypothetical protein
MTGVRINPETGAERTRMNHNMTTTAFTLEGYRVTRTLDVVRGITVRTAVTVERLST